MFYWWIKNSKGELLKEGRVLDGNQIWESGPPTLQFWKKDAKQLCYRGERPVKVKIVEVTK